MKHTKTSVRPDARPGPLGHGYCWKKHPSQGARCIHPAGHQGPHLHPYVRPALRWS